jgi:hypothetical protein
MLKKVLFLITYCSGVSSFAISFTDAINEISKHESVGALNSKSKSTNEQSDMKSSWGDPVFKIAAKNYPIDTLKNDQTPMTGLEFGLSQKLPLTTKYGNIENSFKSLSKSFDYDAKDQLELLKKSFWEILIVRRQYKEELSILNENISWIDKILKVSKKLYSNGKISQQALLDIQIRRSEIESLINNKSYELSKIDDRLSYILKSTSSVDSKTIPWSVLEQESTESKDNRELSLKKKLESKDFGLSASKLSYIPDVTFSLGYTKRSNIDGNGDFIGATIAFPLPFSGEKYSGEDKAVHDKYEAKKNLDNYRRSKQRDTQILRKEISKLNKDLSILNSKTIKFAKNSRLITSKSYGIGNSSYLQLLQSELKLQEILLRKTNLKSKRDIQKVTLKYLLGESLHE